MDTCTLDAQNRIYTTGLLAGRHFNTGQANLHRHSEVELNYLAYGSIRWVFADKTINLTAPRLIVFWAAVPHIAKHTSKNTLQYWYHLPVSEFLSWHLPFNDGILQGEFIQFTTQEPYHYYIFTKISEDIQGPNPALHSLALADLQVCLRRLVLSSQQQTTVWEKPNASNSLEHVTRFIAASYSDQDLTLSAIAEAVGAKPNSLMKAFKRHYGVSVMTYLSQYRVGQAQQLLINSDKNLLDVAFDAGFASTSRFYAVFKKHVGQSPHQYRLRVGSGQGS